MKPTELHRDSMRIGSVGPLILRRGARFLFERILVPSLRPIAKLGFLGRDRRSQDPQPTTSWVKRRPTGEVIDR